jgi:hypothetical protein
MKMQPIALDSDTMQPLSGPTAKPVIYGIQYKVKRKQVIQPIDMDPQPFRPQDLKALQGQLSRSGAAQGALPTKLPRLAFFQLRTDTPVLDSRGKQKLVKLRAGPKAGQEVPIYQTLLRFEKPNKLMPWRQLIYSGGKFEHAVHPNFQVRSEYEEVKADLLNKIGFTKFSEAQKRFVAGYDTGQVRLVGKTLGAALRQIQPPVSSKGLKKKGVVLDFFKRNRVGNIHVEGEVHYIVPQVREGRAVSVKESVPVRIQVRYLSDIPGELSRAIRMYMADKSATYTSPKELAEIEQRIQAKFKGRKKGMKSEAAREELRRFSKPGRLPKSPQILKATRALRRGKISEKDFPLRKAGNVVVNLKFKFYRDISIEDTKKKKAKSRKGGTK